MDKGIAIYNFKGNEANELTVTKNDILDVIEKDGSWWKVKNIRGDIGLVPDDFLAYPVAEDTEIVSRGKVIKVHDATSDNEMTVEIDAQVAIFDKTDEYWWYVGCKGEAGYLPKTIIKLFPNNNKKKVKEKAIPDVATKKSFEVAPRKAQSEENATVLISFQEKLPEQGNFIVVFKGKHCEKMVDAKKINDFTLSIETPKYHPAEKTKMTVNHLKDQEKPVTIGKGIDFLFESKVDIVHRLLMAEADPIIFLCSSFQVENIENIDLILSGFVEKKIPEGFNVLKGGQSVHQEDNPREIPTLLHFAAFYNLTKLAKTLLKCPGAEEASRVTNCHGNVPHALADYREHWELAQILRDNASAVNEDQNQEIYQQMENIYEKYVKMDGEDRESESDYVVARFKSTPTDIYEDMAGRNPSEPEEHYDTPRPECEEDDVLYDEINESRDRKPERHDSETQRQIDEYKVYGRMTEKEVQLALLMKRVKERYITQEQALDMARVLRLEPQVNANTPAVSKKPKVKKKTSVPMMNELTKKIKSLPRTASTSSGSSMSSVGSNGSVASSGYTSEEAERRANIPMKPLPRLPISPNRTNPPKPVPRYR